MSQRELRPGERTVLTLVKRRLKYRRKIMELGPVWAVVDSALPAVEFLDQMEHEVDAAVIAITAHLIESGRSERVFAALKQIMKEDAVAKVDELAAGTVIDATSILPDLEAWQAAANSN